MKNTETFHKAYLERKASYAKRERFDIWNAFPIDNPTDIVDCTPEGNYDNFKHIVAGDQLLYSELINSTPFEGHSVVAGCEPMVFLNSRTCCMFGMDDIDRMKDNVVGQLLWRKHYQVGESDCKIGNVIDAETIDDEWNGMPYRALAILCWTDDKAMERYMNDEIGMTYLAFNLAVSNEICCTCGESFRNGITCGHINKRGLEIVTFAKFNGLAYDL